MRNWTPVQNMRPSSGTRSPRSIPVPLASTGPEWRAQSRHNRARVTTPHFSVPQKAVAHSRAGLAQKHNPRPTPIGMAQPIILLHHTVIPQKLEQLRISPRCWSWLSWHDGVCCVSLFICLSRRLNLFAAAISPQIQRRKVQTS